VPVEEEDVEARAARMSNELAKADPDHQAELFEKYQEGKGTIYTLALAGAIPRLSGEAKGKARGALAQRLTRMTAATLREELKDDDPEIRRAAALACAMKDDKSHVPDLIPLLEDREPIVGRAAHAALKGLTGQDLGPQANASRQEIANAVTAWKGWYERFQAEKGQEK
jgi:HEAT repeat protein